MAKLLCVTPHPGLRTHHGRLAANLIPHWTPHFEKVDVWCTYGTPEEGEALPSDGRYWGSDEPLKERLPELLKMISSGEWSHVWVVGDMSFLNDLASMGLIHDRLEDVLLYAYAIIETPFIDVRYAQVAEYYDFFVCMSGMALGAYKELVATADIDKPKGLFKAAARATAILPGIDTEKFRLLNVGNFEPGREEIRNALFGSRVGTNDVLVTISGNKTMRKGIPQACATIAKLQELVERPVKAYFHMKCGAYEGRPVHVPTFVEGCELEGVVYGDALFREDGSHILLDEQLNMLYNASDLVLCCDLANSWPFTATEAMAAGTVVAVPDEHSYVDAVYGRGIMLPCTEFTWAPWNNSEYCRAIDPAASAEVIAKVLNDTEAFERTRENQLAWAIKDETAQWSYAGNRWANLFGVA